MIFPCKWRQGKLVQSRKMKVGRGYDFHLKIPGIETAVREKNYLNLSVTKLSLEIRCRLLACKTEVRTAFRWAQLGQEERKCF